MSQRISLVAWSGGIDSTYILTHLLRETDDIIIAHHIHMVNREQRWKAEAQACQKIAAHCREHFRDFHYSESTVDRRGMQHFGGDLMTATLEAGMASFHALDTVGRMPDRVWFGMCTEDIGRSTGDDNSGHHVQAILRACSYPNPSPEYHRHDVKSKCESVQYLGRELAEMCWTCRTPRGKAQDTECGECPTCVSMARIRRQLGHT